jgi:hypothetical protein
MGSEGWSTGAMPPEGPFIQFEGTSAAVQLLSLHVLFLQPRDEGSTRRAPADSSGSCLRFDGTRSRYYTQYLDLFYFKPNSLLDGGVGVSPLRNQVALMYDYM